MRWFRACKSHHADCSLECADAAGSPGPILPPKSKISAVNASTLRQSRRTCVKYRKWCETSARRSPPRLSTIKLLALASTTLTSQRHLLPARAASRAPTTPTNPSARQCQPPHCLQLWGRLHELPWRARRVSMASNATTFTISILRAAGCLSSKVHSPSPVHSCVSDGWEKAGGRAGRGSGSAGKISNERSIWG